jgi:hypothetical protein
MLLGVRDLLIKQRTAVINTIRGYAAEFGVIATRGPVKVAELLQQAHTEEARVPALALDMLRLLAAQLDALDVKLKLIETRLMAFHPENSVSQCLVSQPGIGPIGAVSFALNRPDPSPAAKALRGGGRPHKFPSASSQDKGFKVNADGSVDVYLGPKAPAGYEHNWVQTIPGKSWFMILHLYGTLEAWFNKTWRPGEIEEVKKALSNG